ncbi:MAG: response regulator [Ignavibacteria bacterium]|nr:response regulator [Ignavibacteria bacterium]
MDNKAIWLIEDNSDDIELTLRAFRKNNLQNEIIVFNDGATAMENIIAVADDDTSVNTKFPALILLDLKLPKVDGLEILKVIRSNEKFKYIPVVILTSSLEETDLVRGYELGANSYIRKPVDFSKFIEAVQQLEVYWLILNHVPGD